MEKLKTLEEIKEVFNVLAVDKKHIKIGNKIHTGGYFDVVYTKKLRQEAIKQIKYIEKPLKWKRHRFETKEEFFKRKLQVKEMQKNIVNFIKYFFNITEEDLDDRISKRKS